jgi:hypothetical protein
MNKMNESLYLYAPTKLFTEKLESIKVHDPPGFERIIKVRDRLLANPSDADGKMRGLYNGRFKKYVGRNGYRLIYYWCELCRKENRRLDKDCDHCKKISDQSVIFFDLYHKNTSKRI